ncbi:P-loop containing nucleoside triphosphate hydrolase protein [Plectosphaerella cucumerina]|uniref:P-loop containing nucleoside triphosphate hydrolase protein n=1 Tax=Plectosphaerella cucumerina TaxID=40658 RepID=A0A8K0TS95_9PEZI|nr:P-loop containing nucleoside triphosphate hydrolase protein [Plectosphaerella cucumerina]
MYGLPLPLAIGCSSLLATFLSTVPDFDACLILHSFLGCFGWTLLFLVTPAPPLHLPIIALFYVSILVVSLLSATHSSGSPLHPLTRGLSFDSITLSWLNPLVQKGSRETIYPNDLWDVDTSLSVRSMTMTQGPFFGKTMSEKNRPLETSVVSLLIRAHPWLVVSSALLVSIDLAATIVQPFLLRALLGNPSSQPLVIMLALSVVGGICAAHSAYRLRIAGLKLKASLTALVCDAQMQLRRAGGTTNTPDAAVLVASDLSRVFDLVEQVHFLWLVPAQLIISLAALGLLLGWKTVGTRQAGYMLTLMKATDYRVSRVAQVLRQLQQIKLHAWAPFFEAKIDSYRAQELSRVRMVAWANTANMLIVSLLPAAFGCLAFGSHIQLEGMLSAQTIFPALAFLFNISRAVSQLPQVIMLFQGAKVSYGRVRAFLVSSEECCQQTDLQDNKPAGRPHLEIFDASFQASGHESTSSPFLGGCNLACHPGRLVVITGPIDSGKSTLLRAIAGDVHPSSGHVRISGTVAYAPQLPAIINDTVRENILFGLPFEGMWYSQVITAVSLKADFAVLPAGDMTMLGGTRTALSGGQMARVGLARAVYARRDIVVLDDPLVAVDAGVRRQLVDNVLGPSGILKESLRVVTSSVADPILVANEVFAIQHGKLVRRTTEVAVSDVIAEDANEPVKVLATKSPLAFSSGYGAMKDGDVQVVVAPIPNACPSPASNDESSPLLPKKTAGSTRSFAKGSRGSLHLYLQFFNKAKKGGWPLVVCLAGGWKVLEAAGVWTLKTMDTQTSVVGQMHLLAIFALLSMAGGAMVAIFLLAAYFLCLVPASRAIHADLTRGVLRSEMAFLGSIAPGDVLCRFTDDIAKVDGPIAGGLIRMTVLSTSLLSAVGIIVASSPMSIVYLVPVAVAYFCLQGYYLDTCRELRKLEGMARGPILAVVGELRSCAAVIRAHDRGLFFKERLIASLLMLFAGGTAIYLALPASTLGVLVQSRCALEADVVSVDRINAFSETSAEETPEAAARKAPCKWPTSPSVKFQSLTATYRQGIPPCLRDLSLSIKPGQHVAIVGRTGAGKSSLVQAILRGLPPTGYLGGRLVIDGLDITKIPLGTLRGKISLIPQAPVIFYGSLRENLDPLNQFPVADLQHAIECCRLDKILAINPLKEVLDHIIDPSSAPLSSGQLQMLAIARAIISRNNIVILDEATAGLDAETTRAMEEMMRNELRSCTVISITHSIASAVTFDRVVVMGQGSVIESGNPLQLLQDGHSALSQLDVNNSVNKQSSSNIFV